MTARGREGRERKGEGEGPLLKDCAGQSPPARGQNCLTPEMVSFCLGGGKDLDCFWDRHLHCWLGEKESGHEVSGRWQIVGKDDCEEGKKMKPERT